MEKFRNDLKNRLRVTGSFLAVTVIFGNVMKFGAVDTPELLGTFGDFFSGFKYGIYITILFVGIYYMASYTAAMKDEVKLKKMYIDETDERNVKISELVGLRLYKSIIYPLLLATVVSGYFSAEVFFTLLAVTLAISVITFGRKMYFNKTV